MYDYGGVWHYNTWRVDFLASPNYNKLKFHKLTFNPNGGTVAYKSRKAVEGSMYSIMPTPKKSGAKFAGWFTEPEGGVQVKPYMPEKASAESDYYYGEVDGMPGLQVNFNKKNGTITYIKGDPVGVIARFCVRLENLEKT
ncbi:MAG: InlB B-repeat-containing protein [Eubacterium sp.]|nr:InlB B-repeat-containing protein [Eubacterium sp.]